MTSEQATGPLPIAKSSVKEKVDFFEKEIGKMIQLEESRRGSESQSLSVEEQKLEDAQHRSAEKPAVSSNGHAGATLDQAPVKPTVDAEKQGTEQSSGARQATGMVEHPGADANDKGSQHKTAAALTPGTVTGVPVKGAALADGDSNLAPGHPVTPTELKSIPGHQKHPQTAPSSAVEPLSASQDFTGTRTATTPEPFRFSLDKRPRRSSDGAALTPPDASKKKRRPPSYTGAPARDLKAVSATIRKSQTTQKPFNLEGLKRHERALELLKAEMAAKEAEENAPRSFKARPILKPDATPSARVVAPPTKPSAFKLSVEDRAERRDKFKKQVEDRERQLESERDKMLQDLKKELDKEEKQVRRSASFKAAPAKITPDDKVFKPTLGQSPKTTPRAPALGPQRRHSTGSQEGSSEAIPDKGADGAPGMRPNTSRPSSRPASKPASPRVGKPPSPVASKPPSPRPSTAPHGSVKPPSPGPVKPAARGPAQTASQHASRPTSASMPNPKSSPSPTTPRLNKPAPLKSGTPGPKTPSPVLKKAPALSTSTPASPRPPSAAVAKVSTRRSSDSSRAAGKPSSPAQGVASPSAGRTVRSPATAAQRQSPRPLSASKTGAASPRTPSISSPPGVARPLSASAAKSATTGTRSTLSPGPKQTPRKTAAPKVTGKTVEKETEEAQRAPTSLPAEMAVTEKMDAEIGKLGADSTADGDHQARGPPAELGTSVHPTEGAEVDVNILQVPQAIDHASSPEVQPEGLVAAEVEPKNGQMAKVEANGITSLGFHEHGDETSLIQQGHTS